MSTLPTIYYLLSTLLGVPLGYLLSQTTHDEKPIYQKYFPTLLWLLAILSVIFTLLPIVYSPLPWAVPTALTTIFLLITTLTWQKA
ncbi:MAG: hypothetical protein KJ592_05070 [Nanoarchaeota archaeon]|nr:hypothetical protein [Nanoarchaeota archaeon]